MTGVELIVAALAAGASAGVTDTAGNVIRDSYAGLKSLLARRLGSRGKAREALEADEPNPQVWRERIGADLAACGADGDEEILGVARRLLALAHGATAGSSSVHVEHNYGAAGTFNAPVTITNRPVPPAQPGTV